VLSLEDGIPISEHYLCSEHALPLFEQYNSQASAFPSSASALYKDVACVEIKALIGSKDGWSVASLHEKGGRAHFTLELGFVEATELYWNLTRVAVARPLTHVAFASAISALGGILERVTIKGWSKDQTYLLASLHIRQSGNLCEVDVRPSDALNMAIVCRVPIYVPISSESTTSST
jgi:bifunctional DNase/RNase